MNVVLLLKILFVQQSLFGLNLSLCLRPFRLLSSHFVTYLINHLIYCHQLLRVSLAEHLPALVRLSLKCLHLHLYLCLLLLIFLDVPLNLCSVLLLVLDLCPVLKQHALHLLISAFKRGNVHFGFLQFAHGFEVSVGQLISLLFKGEGLYHLFLDLALDPTDSAVQSGPVQCHPVELTHLSDECTRIHDLMIRCDACQIVLFGYLHCQRIVRNHHDLGKGVLD